MSAHVGPSGSTLSVPTAAPSAVSERQVTSSLTASRVIRSGARGFLAQERADRRAKARSSAGYAHAGMEREPVDRLLAAQALFQGLTLVTRDPVFAQYGVRVPHA